MTARHFAALRLIAVCALALGMLILPASSALAAGHHRAHAQPAKTSGKGKKHKKKKKKSNAVIVKCASVTVVCKGKPGPQGPAGTPGANGTNGSAVVLRARGTGTVAAEPEKEVSKCTSSFFSCIGGANVPISPSTWTEGPTEDDQMIGSVTLALPSEAECGAEVENEHKKELTRPGAFVLASVGNAVEGLALAEGGKTAETVTAPLFGDSILTLELEFAGGEAGDGSFIGNGSSQTHTITLKAVDNCPDTQATVSNVAIDVLASY